jgi:hypothetical protein
MTTYATVAIRPCLPPKGERTLTDYQAPIIARYGYMPSMAELAEREGLACDNTKPQNYITPEGRATLQDARRAEGQRTAQLVLDALTRPMTRTDICHKLGIGEVTTTRALQNLHEAGKVTSTRVHSSKVWERT